MNKMSQRVFGFIALSPHYLLSIYATLVMLASLDCKELCGWCEYMGNINWHKAYLQECQMTSLRQAQRSKSAGQFKAELV